MYFNNNRSTTPFGTLWGAPRYNKTPLKVVSIPVRFVGSERNRNDSAMVIQRVARGFLVRKSMKKMLKMKVELEEIDKKVNSEETVKMMKKEQKERIRIGETIMNLLLKLDSVRVFNCGALREFRKSLIKKAIFLQEYVDQIQMVSPKDEVENEDGDCLMKVKEEEGGDEDEKKEESVGSSLMEEEIEENSVDVKEEEEGRNVILCEEEEDEKREILIRMMNENEKMMHMMTQLFEKNEKQTSLLTSLTQRVEQLERAFTCDKLKKKNNRRRNVDPKHRYNGCI
ncbi:BAG family molecular chaperone regulator 5, mitochondrial-like [Vicia villosa]|uniref:BAG family molecular chaperone regulator 5, mitochondrial-like n=1 Tax=Vicia villosa TaxID=3911 RepID=UPI00273B8090|nr:BAG family molecular chaperone regulator 5, mitochondrial-like [Vicia villosa]